MLRMRRCSVCGGCVWRMYTRKFPGQMSVAQGTKEGALALLPRKLAPGPLQTASFSYVITGTNRFSSSVCCHRWMHSRIHLCPWLMTITHRSCRLQNAV